VMQFWGSADLITPIEDVETFQSEYGGSNELRTLPGAGHAPYIAESDLREAFWTETFEFLDYDPVTFYLACEP
jgi:pimeloyl-ACP methyl ester carboxylesterase